MPKHVKKRWLRIRPHLITTCFVDCVMSGGMHCWVYLDCLFKNHWLILQMMGKSCFWSLPHHGILSVRFNLHLSALGCFFPRCTLDPVLIFLNSCYYMRLRGSYRVHRVPQCEVMKHTLYSILLSKAQAIMLSKKK